MTIVTLVLIVAVNLGLGVLPGVDNFAHIGGFATGFLLGFVLLIRPHYGWIRRLQAPLHDRSVWFGIQLYPVFKIAHQDPRLLSPA